MTAAGASPSPLSQMLGDKLTEMGVATRIGASGSLGLQLTELRRSFINAVLEKRGLATRFYRDEKGVILQPEISDCQQTLLETLCLALKPDLLCLDVDGTLVDVDQSFDLLVATLVENHTGRRPTKAEILAYRASGGYNDDFRLAQAMMVNRGVDRDLELVAREGRRLYLGTEDSVGFCERETLLINQGFLSRLSSRVAIALVTGRNSEELAPALPMLEPPAETFLAPIDLVSQGKPDPEGILLAANSFQASRIWMVGDNVDDILAARAAGGLAIGVGPNRDALQAVGADWILNDINQIEELL